MSLSKKEAARLKNIGTRIRETREHKGLTLEEVEDRGGPTWRHMIKIEYGKNHNVTTLLKIADALGVAPSKLVDDL